MKKSASFLFCLCIGMFFACNAPVEAQVSKDGLSYFGTDFKVKDVVSMDDLLQRLSDEESIEDVVVEGRVESVCQAKGCWMNIVSTKNPDGEKVFVKFQDYGFFVPKDLSGSTVIMKGRAYSEETSVDELRHYAEDEGKSAEEIAAITAPVRELKFMATGVKIKK